MQQHHTAGTGAISARHRLGARGCSLPIPTGRSRRTAVATPAPPAPDQATVEQIIEEELEKEENKLLRDWLNYQLGLPGAEDPLGISGPNASHETLQRTATVLDEYTDPDKRRRSTEETLRKCRIPLWHYTSPSAAGSIYVSKQMFESPPYQGHPAGAFATTITPLNPGWTQPQLAGHLGIPSSSAWVLLCIDDGPNKRFRPDTSDPNKPDYWYAPADPGRDIVDVEPAAWGLNPMSGGTP